MVPYQHAPPKVPRTLLDHAWLLLLRNPSPSLSTPSLPSPLTSGPSITSPPNTRSFSSLLPSHLASSSSSSTSTPLITWASRASIIGSSSLSSSYLFQPLSLALHTQVLPNSRHRLCLWHIEKNFVAHFGSLKSNEEFKNMFKNCLMGCDDVSEFEKLWAEMMEKYGHQKEQWFNQVYAEKHKWCTALNRDIFSAGILSSQRSEVTNKAISFNAKATTNLFEFYHIFEQTMKRWRSNETSDSFRNRSERPKAIKSKSKLLRHAAEVYTLSLFNDFETEYEWAMASSLRSFETENSDLKLFEVSSEEDFSNSHKVVYNERTTEFVCTCQCFTETGMICFHIIRVMHMYSIFKIPERYIVKRWTRLAKSAIWENNQSDKEANPYANLWTPWRHAITKNFYNLVSICQANEEARKLCDNSLKELYQSVKEVFKTDEQKQQEIEEEERRREVVENPEVIKTKGRPPKGNKRIKGHFEKRKTKTRHPNEYGTKTPNVEANQ